MTPIKSKTENLIVKYISKSATAKDLDELILWVDNADNLKTFKAYVKDHYAINFSMMNINNRSDKDRILQEIKKEKKRLYQNRFKSLYKYAAAILLFIGVGYFIQKQFFTKNSEIIISEEKITLQLENGNIEILNEDGSSQVVDVNGNIIGRQEGAQLTYANETETEDNTLKYNTLSVPYGKRFDVTLSDGTHVHLNAGTTFKYPIKFIKGLSRKVFLITGEAYFDVTKDENHPFIANTDNINIRVLGTKFNISSYKEESQINTVLVEGSVSILKDGETYNASSSTVLPIEHMATWNKKGEKLVITETEVEDHIAWIEGRLILNEVPFNTIMKKLERQYDVTFVNNNKVLESRVFTARFDIEDINQVMTSLSEAANFIYRINNNNQIIINP
ncbi:FecR family protein [Wocania ichthyoenteri]|uniref:FecR family protein n=1 Tax=Wocania ichthyoenteri TaxID=1230531 RepID=UPI00068C7F34|nr:FecR family protein [Wocania ichthyoenteri]